MTSRYYTMTDSTGESGFLPTVVFDGSSGVFTSMHRINTLGSIGITGFYEADFANTVTTIDVSAFAFDTKVVVATINGVTTINNDAFYGCSALRSITLDTSVNTTTKKYLLTSIGNRAFHSCTSLRHLHIPDTVKNIPNSMCNGCTSLEFAVMGYGWNRNGNDYVTDSTIGQEAFNNCSNLSYFVVPETVAAIGDKAFANNGALRLVNILGTPDVSSNAFSQSNNESSTIYYYNTTKDVSNCFPSAVSKRAYTEVTFSATGTLTSAITTTALTGVNSYWKGKISSGVNAIGIPETPAFRAAEITAAKYSNMIGMSFPSSLTTINYGSFESWVNTGVQAPCNVTGFYFPNSVTTFALYSGDSAAFRLGSDVNMLASSTRQFVFLSGTNTVTFGPVMFQHNCAHAYIIPNITIIPHRCFNFSQNSYFFSFFQKNAYTQLTTVGNDTQFVFEGCFQRRGITGYRHYIHIPKQVTYIGTDAFRSMSEKLVVTVYHNTINSAGTTLTTGLVTSQNLTWTSSTAFGSRFMGGPAPTIHIINNNYDSNGNALTSSFSLGTGFLYHVLYSSNVKTITNRFAGLVDLKSIAVHHSATQTVGIDTAAFQNCTGLNFVYFNNRVKTMGYNAFRNIPLSASFDLIDAHPLEAIYHATFYIDNITSNLTQITIPNSVKALGTHAFGNSQLVGKQSFTTLSFENGIAFWGDYNNDGTWNKVTIAEYGFPDTNNARYMAIPANFCVHCAFLRNVSFLNTVDANNNVIPADGNGALARPNNNLPITTRINSQILNPPIRRIGNAAFISNYRLQSIRIPDGVTIIDSQAFYDAYSMSYIYLPDSLTTMGLAAFNFVGLSNQFGYTGKEVYVRIPQALIDFVQPHTYSATTGYFNTNNESTIFVTVSFNTSSSKVASGVLERFTTSAVNDYIFYHVVTLSGITGIRGSFTSNTRAFDNFTSLKTLTIADTVTSIGPAACQGCTSLTNVFISPTSNLTIIDDSAFRNCSGLTDIYLGNKLQTISFNAFRNALLSNTFDLSSATTLQAIYHAAFMTEPGYTSNIRQITIPNSVKVLGSNVFDCSQTGLPTGLKPFFTSLSFQNGIEFLGDFDNTLSSTGTIAGYGVNNSTNARYMAIPANFCRNCNFLNSVSFLDTLDSGGNAIPADGGALARPNNNLPITTRINTQTLSPAIRRIGISAFQANDRLQSIRIPEGVTTIDVGAFYDAYSLSYIYLPDSLTSAIGINAFSFAGISNKFGYVGKEVSVRIPQSRIDDVSSNRFGTHDGSTFHVTVPFDNTSSKVVSGVLQRFTSQAATSVIFYHVVTLNGITGIRDGSTLRTGAFDGVTSLKTVTIADTITSIGYRSFNNCSGLTNVFFSPTSTLSTIGVQAFLSCNNLTTITIPSLVTDISTSAFSSLTGLTSVSFSSPGSLVNIGSTAFNGCTALTDISMNRVKSIGPQAFMNVPLSNTFDLSGATSLEAIYVAAFFTNTTGTSNLRQITIPSSVKVLGSLVFASQSLGRKLSFTTLSFASGINFWGDYDGTLFSANTTASYEVDNTSSLRHMAIPANFCENCNLLTSIANVLNKNPKYIGDSAFATCSALTTFTIADTVTNIGNSAFSDCSGLTSASISATSNLVTIGSSAFLRCNKLTTINIPSLVTNIGNSAFSDCSGLTSASISATSNLVTIGQFAFLRCNRITTINIPSLVTDISTSAFSDCSGLTSVSFSPTGSLVSIGNNAFFRCTRLTDISMNRVKSIGITAFYNVPLSNTFDLSGATSLEAIYSRAFVTDASGTSNIRQITIPNSVKVLGSGVFASGSLGGKREFTTLSFQNGISFWGDVDSTVGDATFTETDTNNARYMAIPLEFCINCDFLTSVNFLDTVDANGSAIPADAGGALVRPENSLPIPTRFNKQILNPPIRRIGNSAFQSNHRLQSIRIPDGVTTIDFQAFYDAYSLSYIYLPDSLTSAIGVSAFNFAGIFNKFSYDGKQVSVRIPQSRIDDVNTTSFNTFGGSSFHITVPFNTSSSKVASGVLGRFTSQAANSTILYHVVTLNGISGILGSSSTPGARAFGDYTTLKTVTIADTVTNIGWGAFSGCTGLTNVFISPTSNLTLLENSAFVNCTALTSFFIPNSLKVIETSGFNNTGLASVTYGDNPGLKFIGSYAFYSTTKTLTSIFIPSSVVHIGSEAFITNSNTEINVLNYVTFGAGSRLKSIDYQCFGYNGNGIQRAAQYLRDLVFPSSLRYMGTTESPLQNTHRLAHSANLVMPSSVEVIPWAFLYADGSTVDISNIYFPRSITNVAGPRVHNGYSVNRAGSSTGLAGAEFSDSKSGSLIYLPSELSAYTGYSGYAFPGPNRTRSFYKTKSLTDNPLITLGLGLSIVSTANATDTSQIHANIQEGVVVIGNGTDSIAGTGTISPRNLISVNIPSTVTNITANAFSGCTALVYVTFSENSKLSTIGNSAFLNCSMIHDIQLPDTLTTIGANAFSGCYNLASISIPYNVTSIGAGAFNINSTSTPPTDIVRPGGYVAYQLGQDIYGEAISDYSGYSVSLSQDGKILAIGSQLNDAGGGDAGQVRVYKYQTITDATWTNYTVGSFFQNGTAPFNKPIVVNGGDALPVSGKYYWVQLGSDINGEAGYNYAGWSVSLSSDGTTVAIGALVNYGAGSDAGQVRVYKYQTITDANWTNYNATDFSFNGISPYNKPIVASGGDGSPIAGKFYWVQLGGDIDGVANSQSGNSVALNSNGTIVVIGARLADIPVTDGGSVRIYQYNGSTTWNQLGSTITGGDSVSDMIGYSVAISDDGFTIAYGAPKFDTYGGDRGLVNIFKWNGTAWNQVGGTHIQGEAAGDNFGESVSLSSDGTIIAIGAFANDGGGAESTGHVRVFKFNGTSWNQLGQDIDGIAIYENLGNSVSLSSDGTILAVGAQFSDPGSKPDTGYARIYKFVNGAWQQLGKDIKGELAYDYTGTTVSLSKDGTTVAIGTRGNDSNGHDSGMVRVYQISNFTVRLHQRLYDTIHDSFSTYFPGISPGAVQVIPELQLTNTLNPSNLTISQINNLYIRYRQSQLGFCSRVTVAASSGGTLSASDVTNALSGTTGLVHLDISTNVTFVEAEVCLNNSRIYSVAIPQTVTNIRFSAFNSCTNLTYLSFHPDSVCTTIATAAFHNTKIYDLALPDSLTTIGNDAFWSSFNLTSVCIPKNVTSLGTNAFYNCSKLTSVALPSQLSTANTSSYFNTNGSTVPGTFTIYHTAAAIPHFKLSEYSLPSGIVQTVIDSAVTYIDHRAYAYYPDITLYAVTTNKQTQTAGQYNYVMNGVKMPFQPAAFLLNGAGFASNSMFPLYRSIPDLNVFSLSNAGDTWPANSDDLYILMPGYSICIYNNLYDEENLFTASPTERYFDNEFGKVPLNITLPSGIPNTTTSILIMYKGRILSKYFST